MAPSKRANASGPSRYSGFAFMVSRCHGLEVCAGWYFSKFTAFSSSRYDGITLPIISNKWLNDFPFVRDRLLPHANMSAAWTPGVISMSTSVIFPIANRRILRLGCHRGSTSWQLTIQHRRGCFCRSKHSIVLLKRDTDSIEFTIKLSVNCIIAQLFTLVARFRRRAYPVAEGPARHLIEAAHQNLAKLWALLLRRIHILPQSFRDILSTALGNIAPPKSSLTPPRPLILTPKLFAAGAS